MRAATRRAAVLGVSRGAAADWWVVPGQTCVAAYKPIGAASLPTSYINLANPGTYNAAPGTAPGLAAGGWTFNGSTQYLTSGIVPIDGLQSVIVRCGGMINNASILGCQRSTTPAAYVQICRNVVVNGMQYSNVSGGTAYIPPIETDGIFAIAGRLAYRNGLAESSTMPAAGVVDNPILFGCRGNSGGAAIEFFAGTIAAVAIYSTTLLAADVASLTTRMQNLA